MYKLVRNFLFLINPERVHHWVMWCLNIGYKIPFVRKWMKAAFVVKDTSLQLTLWGITFPNPVGLAAGFDKNAKYTDALACLGFGFVEIGTVTPRPQLGNPKPRLFRLPVDKALINRMGFNNQGVAAAAAALRKRDEKIIMGGNIGKNKDTPNENAVDDYEACFKELYAVVDYFVVNVSSPNTPGLRALQDKEPLMFLLNRLQVLNKQLGIGKPILLKIAPDLTDSQLDDIIDIVKQTAIQGIVATNTTIARNMLNTDKLIVEKMGQGGVSGMPLRKRATEVISYIHKHSGGAITIMAAGGIFTAEDAKEKLEAGASLVQLYTGFIYQGPAVAANICRGILAGGTK